MTNDHRTSGQNEPVPVSTLECAIEVAGTTLYWKQTLEKILRRAGVSQTGYDRYRHLSKFQIARSLLDDLENVGPRGWAVQQRIVQELANLKKCEARADQEAGMNALRDLRRVAVDQLVLISPEESKKVEKREKAAESRQQVIDRRTAISTLNNEFLSAHSEENRQKRGYQLERFWRELCRLNEMTYTGAYKTDTDQVDGSFSLDSFTYLLEAKWQDKLAMDADIGTFVHKVERRLDATRGIFLSMSGFRDETMGLYRLSKENRVIFMDGQDLSLILSGHFDFVEALQEKIAAASIRGEPYQRLAAL